MKIVLAGDSRSELYTAKSFHILTGGYYFSSACQKLKNSLKIITETNTTLVEAFD